MPDEPHVIRGINWRDVFAWTNIFRGFRVAVHPSKLALALVAILVLYVASFVLDAVWPATSKGVPDEVAMYQTVAASNTPDPGTTFDAMRAARRKEIEDAYAAQLTFYGIASDDAAAAKMAHNSEGLSKVESKIVELRDKTVKDKVEDPITAYSKATVSYQLATRIAGVSLFQLFFDYEVGQINGVVQGVREWNWTTDSIDHPAVVASVVRFFTVGPSWAVKFHCVYFFVWGILFLIVWSIFGGAIARIAAVHIAREEKLSVQQALKFSINKFLSFVFAPIIPLAIVVVVGLLVALVSLLSWFAWIGPIIIGILFFLAIAAGFVMTLVLLGLVGGLNLMYPTIAVEGSDSFDAISRSFSYVYARPWRTLFYTAVAIVYGALTYLFVRVVIYLTLTLAHTFVGLWFGYHAGNGVSLFPMLWPAPSFWHLPPTVDYFSLSSGESIAAHLISMWVYIAISLMGAYVISYYFSVNTIIYYLLRHNVDATEMDDVYLEQPEEEFTETAPATAPAIVAPTEPAPPAVDTPPNPV